MPVNKNNKISLDLKAEILSKVNKKAGKYFKASVENKEHDDADKILNKM